MMGIVRGLTIWISAKFAPATAPSSAPAIMASPTSSVKSADQNTPGLKRSGTVADRINAKLRDANVSNPALKPLIIDGKELPRPPSPSPPDGHRSPGSPTREEMFTPPTDPNGKPTINGQGSPKDSLGRIQTSNNKSDLPAQPILLSGLALPAQALQDLLNRFEAYLLTTPAPYAEPSSQIYTSTKSNLARVSRQRSNILGTYEKTFSGEEVVNWLREHIEGFGGDHERSADAAEELYRMGHFSRLGVGRGFDPAWDTYYVLKAKNQSGPTFHSPLSPATNANIQNMVKHFLPSGLSAGVGDDEPLHVKVRREADKADESYRRGVNVVEERRLEMEERIERGLRIWERWERERLSVVKTGESSCPSTVPSTALSRPSGRSTDMTCLQCYSNTAKPWPLYRLAYPLSLNPLPYPSRHSTPMQISKRSLKGIERDHSDPNLTRTTLSICPMFTSGST